MQRSFIDPNNVDYRDSLQPVGEISSISHDPPVLRMTGLVDVEVEGRSLIVVDSARRFVLATPLSQNDFCVEFTDRHLQISAWPLSVYVYDPSSNMAYPLKLGTAAEGLAVQRQSIPTLRDRYIDTIRAAMGQAYTAVSSKSDITTGNNYQSIDLDTLLLSGGRPTRSLFFRHVNFKGKRVLDIGANMGELSRLARRRGADLVDGYEYDPFFVETGRAINAVAGATRVSLFQGDATNPDLYAGMKYDMVIAFSVWVYIDKVLDRIAAITDTVFFETHTLDHGLGMYIQPMIEHFPCVRLVGHEQQRDMRQSRAVLMFAKTPAALDNALSLVRLKTEPYFQNQFFHAHSKTTGPEFVDYARHIAETIVEDGKFSGIGKPYFELLIAGYFDYIKQRHIAPDNIYLQSYRRAIMEGRFDPNLAYLVDDDARLVEKVQKKFTDIDNAVAGRWNLVPPIIVKPADGPHVFTDVGGKTITAENIDGHHRYFIAQLLSKPTIDALLGEPSEVQRTTLHKQSPSG